MPTDRIKRIIFKGKYVICRFVGHDFYVSDIGRIKVLGGSTHAVCAFCHTLFRVTSTYDGVEPGFRWEQIE